MFLDTTTGSGTGTLARRPFAAAPAAVRPGGTRPDGIRSDDGGPDGIASLADDVVRDGLAVHEGRVAALFGPGLAAGVPTAVVDAMCDRRLADVLRLRALGRVLVALG